MPYIGAGIQRFNTADGLTVNGTAEVTGASTLTGAVTADAGVSIDNITIDGTEIDLSSGNLTLDVAGDINLDADGGDVNFKDGGTSIGYLSNSSGTLLLGVNTSDADFKVQGNDGGSTINALTIDMSEAGAATFNAGVTVANSIQFGSDAQTKVAGAGSSDVDLLVSGDTNIRFETGTNEQMRIDSSGNVGIGTTSPTQPLSISANGANGLFLVRDEGDAADSCRLFFDSSNTRYALFAKDGVLSIRSGGTPGSSSGTERVQFTVNGINSAAVAANGTVSAANLFISGGNNFQKSSSSSRYKTDITDSTRGLSDVMKMRSVTYKGINDGDRFFGGLIAEEVHDAGLIEYVDYRQDDDGNDIPEGVHYGHMVALAFKAIQELKTELDAEKAKTAALQTQVADLITRVTALEAE